MSLRPLEDILRLLQWAADHGAHSVRVDDVHVLLPDPAPAPGASPPDNPTPAHALAFRAVAQVDAARLAEKRLGPPEFLDVEDFLTPEPGHGRPDPAP